MIKAFDVELPANIGKRGRSPKVTVDIQEFLNGNHIVAEIELEGKKADNVGKLYSQMVSNLGLSDNIMVSRRAGRVFMIKKEVEQ